jgi:hypothetical protein
MAWTLFVVPATKKGELDAILKDDQISRQSQKIRDAATIGGSSGELYVLIEGLPDAILRAEEFLGQVGKKLPAPDAEALYQKFKAEEESASAGMGLFFTEE